MLANSTQLPKVLGNICLHLITRLSHTEANAVIGEKSIHYVRTTGGPPAAIDGPAVLLMPGALGSAWNDFRPQLEKLPALLPNRTIIAWDPPGYGRSTPPKRTFPVDFFQRDAKDAYDLMQELGFERYSLLRWSDGGMTAMIMAANHPDVVEKLVVWGASSYLLKEEIAIFESNEVYRKIY